MTRTRRIGFLSGLCVALGASGVVADEVHLRDGRVLEGSVTEVGNSVIVRLNYGEVRFDRAEVLRIVDTVDAWDQLEDLRARFSQGTADERYQYAVFCRDNGFEGEAREAFLSVLRVDTDHPGARAALGYVQHQGRWITRDDFNRARGLVEYQGEWVTPQERDARVADARAEREARRAEREAEREAERLARDEAREARRAEREERLLEHREALAEAEVRRAQALAAARQAEAEAAYRRQNYFGGLGWGPIVVNGRYVQYRQPYWCTPRRGFYYGTTTNGSFTFGDSGFGWSYPVAPRAPGVQTGSSVGGRPSNGVTVSPPSTPRPSGGVVIPGGTVAPQTPSGGVVVPGGSSGRGGLTPGSR